MMRFIRCLQLLFFFCYFGDYHQAVISTTHKPTDSFPNKLKEVHSVINYNFNFVQNDYKSTSKSTSKTKSDEEEWYIVRSAHSSGLVLDAEEPSQIKLQHLTGFPAQLWKFERASRPGVYHIISNLTKVLDVKKDTEGLILNQLNSHSRSQQWILNSNGRIYNVGFKKNIDVWGGHFRAGKDVGLYEDNGSVAQEFVVQRKEP